MQLADQRGHVEESDISLHLHYDDISSEHGANFVAFFYMLDKQCTDWCSYKTPRNVIKADIIEHPTKFSQYIWMCISSVTFPSLYHIKQNSLLTRDQQCV